MRVFILHLLNENDINIFEITETQTQHFDTSNYIPVIGEVHLLNVITELLLFLFISLIIHISIHRRKNKNCVSPKLCSPISPDIIASPSIKEFVPYSEDKITCKILAFL